MLLLCSNSLNRLRAPRAPAGTTPSVVKLLAARVQHLVPPSARQHVGDFISPRAYKLVGETPVWAADNDAFSGFHEARYCRMLETIARHVQRGGAAPMFVTVPDVVGNHFSTERLWNRWAPIVKRHGLPAAFVLQNGVDLHWQYWLAGHADFPWDEIDALFIGGDTAFKFSEEVREIVEAANYHGKWVHMGRVNSVKRMRYAKAIGCNSCDGSGMARFPNHVLLPMIRALQADDSGRQLQLL